MDEVVQEKLIKFFKQYKLLEFKRGSTIISPSNEPEGAYFLDSGVIRMYALSKNGTELTLNIFKPTSFFPMSWILNDRDSHYYYDAVADTKLYCAPKEDFKKFIRENSDVTFDLLKRIYRGLEGFMWRMESLLSGDSYMTLIINLYINFLRFGDNQDGIVTLKLSHKEIATQTGLARETVTRLFKKLKDKKILEYKDGRNLSIHLNKLETELAR